jgi:hypothetical protein
VGWARVQEIISIVQVFHVCAERPLMKTWQVVSSISYLIDVRISEGPEGGRSFVSQMKATLAIASVATLPSLYVVGRHSR